MVVSEKPMGGADRLAQDFVQFAVDAGVLRLANSRPRPGA
jgi:orotate phosphoribosyltransferase